METAAASAAVRRRLASILRAADSTMQRRLAKVSTELAQTDTELLCERAHSQHLAQERQEVADRERSLSRQVDVAVMVIAALREQLNASENELERRERRVQLQAFLKQTCKQSSVYCLTHSSCLDLHMQLIVCRVTRCALMCLAMTLRDASWIQVLKCRIFVSQGGVDHPEVSGGGGPTRDVRQS